MSALAFSPDGLKLAAGDVSIFLHLYSYLSMAQLLLQNLVPPACQSNSMCICGAAADRAEFFYDLLLARFFSYQTKKSPVGKSSFMTSRSAK